MSDKEKAIYSIFFGALIGGATTSMAKIGVSQMPPLSFAFLRFFLAGIIILPVVIKNKYLLKDYISLFPLSFLATVNIALFAFGIVKTTATIGQLLYAGVPLIVTLLSFIIFKERIKRHKILGIILGFIGVIVIVLLPVLEKGKAFSGNLTGNILIAFGVLFWSTYMIFSGKVLKKYSPFFVTSSFIFTCVLFLLPFFLLDLKIHPLWWSHVNSQGLTSVVYIAIGGTILTYVLGQYAIRHGGSVIASTTYYLLPFFAFLSAFVLLSERLTSGIIIGGLLAFLGVFFVTKK